MKWGVEMADVFRIFRDKKYDDGICERRMIGLENELNKRKGEENEDL